MVCQPVGDLRLEFDHGTEVSGHDRRLRLTTATTSTSYVVNGVAFDREVFASAPDQVIAVRLTADQPGAISFTASFGSPQRTTVASPDGTTIALDGGVVSSAAGTLRVTGADAVTLLISIGSSYANFHAVGGDYQGIAWQHLRAAETVRYDRLRRRHVADYQELFRRVTIGLAVPPPTSRPTSGSRSTPSPTTRSSPRCSSSSAATC
ncbi:glycoside hydrolase N-terminal domain-containing protein [Paractinoplanes rishiriensis]|uniref:Glycosyl hydrolase family 95 N-terminal domain-containing protein n=1 Tax=Paractinoplanes rishiriensis TaxID=1050105 RepID=A0A919K211_9ACTN|nr:glycoside hydrolase N-terminal domain-containing protein [Actinoplanes rishiriensis]GIE99225.1 hypothetical protein Ari01nite_66900 [Actinoplanes rishiriensis]